MHLTLFAFGSWGDVRPLVVLGMGLKTAGHQARIVASPGYAGWVRERGLDFFPLTVDVQKIAADNAASMRSTIERLRVVRNELPKAITQIGLDVLEASRGSDALLTIEFSLAFLLGVVQVNNLRTIIVNPGPLTPTGAFPSAGVPPRPVWLPFPQLYNRLSYQFVQRLEWMIVGKARHSLDARLLGSSAASFRDFQAMLADTHALTLVSPHVVPRPPDWGDNQHLTGYLFDDDPDWSPPQALLDFLAAGKPPVYIGFGSMPDPSPAMTTRLLIDAVQIAGQRAVILKGWARYGSVEIPENVYVLDYAPHNWLFPRMAAVAHHGGAGTTAAGFRAGVPMTVVPHNGDQPYWGSLAARLGVGTAPIPRKKLTAARLARALGEATTSLAMQDKAVHLSRKIASEDGVELAVRAICSIMECGNASNYR